MALAVQAVWEEAAAEVQTLAGRCFFFGWEEGKEVDGVCWYGDKG